MSYQPFLMPELNVTHQLIETVSPAHPVVINHQNPHYGLDALSWGHLWPSPTCSPKL
uniref:Uncharacterized protein n=1 Tax=Arundo donax TaxID=35708 RepID=A0A0A9H632_ARUDO